MFEEEIFAEITHTFGFDVSSTILSFQFRSWQCPSGKLQDIVQIVLQVNELVFKIQRRIFFLFSLGQFLRNYAKYVRNAHSNIWKYFLFLSQ